MNILLECMPVEMNIEYLFIMTHIQRCQPVQLMNHNTKTNLTYKIDLLNMNIK